MAPALQTKFVFSLAIKIGAPIVAGDLGHGVRRITPILGGEVRGEKVNGTIFPCGADFQIIRPNGFTELEAKYAFETDDGAVIYIENIGIRFGPKPLLDRIAQGEIVDPALIYGTEIRNRRRQLPLADGKPVHPCRRAASGSRRDRGPSGVVRLGRFRFA